MAKDDPRKLARISYGLLPRDVFISVEQKARGRLDPDAYAALRRLLDVIESRGAIGLPARAAGKQTG